MATIRCCRCKTIVGLVSDVTAQTAYTLNPCDDCRARDQAIREKGAGIRRAQAAAKAGREGR